MNSRVLIGAALVLGAVLLGRRRRASELGQSQQAQSFTRRTADDIAQFALQQFPRDEVRPGDDPLVTSDFITRMQCEKVEPFLQEAIDNASQADDLDPPEPGALAARVLASQAWAAGYQLAWIDEAPTVRCVNFKDVPPTLVVP